MAVAGKLSLFTHFKGIRDPRIDRTKRHLLMDIIALVICAVIGNADGWEEIEEYGKQKLEFLKTFLRLPHGIPSHDTIERVFQRIKPLEFERSFRSWTRALAAELGLKQVAIDGKTLRRSFDRAGEKAALHLVSAWCVENHFTLAQVAVDGKSNEITAIPQLLRMLEISGAIVTIDAMGCQRQIAAQVVEAKADYLLAVKDNHPQLHEDILDHFLKLHEADFVGAVCRHRKTENKSHGRVERRDYYSTPVPQSLRNAQAWRGLQSIGQVVSQIERDGRTHSEVRLFISSLKYNDQRLAAAVRNHWGIENSCHWVLDVTFREDDSRIRKGHGAENLALVRRLALSLIKQAQLKGSIRRHRKIAAMNNDHLLTLLAAAG